MPARVISSEQQRDRMLYTPIPKLIVSLSVPTLASQLISVFYNTADTYFVSKLSTSASAAVGVVFSLMSIIQAFGFGIGMGCGSIISRSLGNRDNERANRTASSAFFFAAAVGLLICIAGLCTLRPLMRLLGSTETILPYSESYARIILLAAPIMCASFVLNNTLRSEGEAMLSMYGICTGGLLLYQDVGKQCVHSLLGHLPLLWPQRSVSWSASASLRGCSCTGGASCGFTSAASANGPDFTAKFCLSASRRSAGRASPVCPRRF
jgi:hypothetical protein